MYYRGAHHRAGVGIDHRHSFGLRQSEAELGETINFG
jgi:hypothetical protein